MKRAERSTSRRANTPFQRDVGATIERWAHVGIYGCTLRRWPPPALAPTALEQTKSLEQLRALGHGIAITCVKTTHSSAAVESP